MGGGHLFVGKANPPKVLRIAGLQSDQYEPVQEEGHARGNHWLLNHESKQGNMSKHDTNHGLWISMAAYAVKNLLTSAHFFLHDSNPAIKATTGNNFCNIANALLGSGGNQDNIFSSPKTYMV